VITRVLVQIIGSSQRSHCLESHLDHAWRLVEQTLQDFVELLLARSDGGSMGLLKVMSVWHSAAQVQLASQRVNDQTLFILRPGRFRAKVHLRVEVFRHVQAHRCEEEADGHQSLFGGQINGLRVLLNG
jgi:hypothetical protein